MLMNPRDMDLFHAVPYPMVEETVYSYLVLGLYNPPVLPFSAGTATRDEALEVVLRFYEVDAYAPGDFGSGCDFERQYGHRVTRKDVRDFLNARPHGVYTTRDTFEHFLQARYGRSGAGTSASRPAAQPERPLTYRSTPTYRPASSSPQSTESRSDSVSQDQQRASAFRPTPSYRPAPPSGAAQTAETSGQTADRAEAPPLTPPTPKYRPAPPSPSSRKDEDNRRPPCRPMTVQAAPAQRPGPASVCGAAAVPFGPAFRGHAMPDEDGGEETSVLQRVLPAVIRVVCIAFLVFLFVERRLTDQWLGPILLIAGIVFAKDLTERWSVERLSVCGILLLLFLSGHLLRWWVFSAILVLVFFYFN